MRVCVYVCVREKERRRLIMSNDLLKLQFWGCEEEESAVNLWWAGPSRSSELSRWHCNPHPPSSLKYSCEMLSLYIHTPHMLNKKCQRQTALSYLEKSRKLNQVASSGFLGCHHGSEMIAPNWKGNPVPASCGFPQCSCSGSG